MDGWMDEWMMLVTLTVSDQKQRIDATSPYMMLGAAGDHVLSLPAENCRTRKERDPTT